MTANYTLYAVDSAWLAENPNATFETVPDDALNDSIDLEQAFLERIFEGRSDALRYLANGEFGPAGGLAEWDGSDCYMGFVSAKKAAEISRILSETSPEQLLQTAAWIAEDDREEISEGLNAFYSDLKQFIEGAVSEGNGLACLFVE
ncbi:hypothetical protein MHY87_10585 [Microvirga sp. ACRRW]|uniref:hypothetical protein n=1 Tax=Microvirga sp. ACRRW TaxID=2918205 RepID=UPI001EF3E36B|nr:hypothetical protein [Microvirga sp. ACRRW]MCG7393352.1 hypothetical protein [Microvirga sp. ACRRW]